MPIYPVDYEELYPEFLVGTQIKTKLKSPFSIELTEEAFKEWDAVRKQFYTWQQYIRQNCGYDDHESEI